MAAQLPLLAADRNRGLPLLEGPHHPAMSQHTRHPCDLDHHCRLTTGNGGLELIRIENGLAEAEIYLDGGHVAHYQPRRAAKPVLWTSAHSHWQQGEPIRGGVPVCWPWFGASGPADSPPHGIARIATWRWIDSAALTDGGTRVVLALEDSTASRRWWPHPFTLQLAVTVGHDLDLALRVRNQGQETVTWTGALHTYFAVSDVRQVQVEGLSERTFVDRMDGDARKVQHGPIAFEGETDRIYLDPGPVSRIVDPAWDRRIVIAKRGSGSTVVWNPWVAKSARMPDFGDEEWPEMCCVETARAADDACTLAPGEKHELGVTIGVE
jgi:glucose-6-phosphate 1-epimerase